MKQKFKLISAIIIAGIAMTSNTIAQTNITGSGTNNYVLKFTSTGSTAGNSSIFDNGNVGIGTLAPGKKIDVNGDALIGASGRAAGHAFLFLDAGNGAGNEPHFRFSQNTVLKAQIKWSADAAGGIDFYTVGTGSFVRFTNAGNVGIGIMAPAHKLDVSGNINVIGGSEYKIGGSTVVRNDGTANIFLGENSGTPNTGSYNTFVGVSSGWTKTTGDNNTLVGFCAGANTTVVNSAGQNTFIGSSAGGYNTTGTENVYVGVTTGAYNNQGTFNTVVGNRAGLGVWTVSNYSNNSFFGYQSGALTTSGSNNVFMGYHAGLTNSTGSENTANGKDALYSNTTGSSNTALGFQAGYNGATHSQCTFIGSAATLTTNRTNVTLLGYGIVDAQSTGNDQVCIGNTAITQVRAPAAVTGFTSYSDARVKTNIKENVVGLDFILKLKPKTYNVRPRELHKIWGTADSVVNKMNFSETEKTACIGFIAQEVEKAAKESGFNFPGIDVPRNNKEVYTLRYVDFIMPMIKGMQEQQTMIDSLKTTTASLKKDKDQQDSVISALKKQMDQFASFVNARNPNQLQSLGNLTDVELSDKNVVVLDQNVPNPFAEQTTISYYLPDNVTRAQIIFLDQSGKIIKAVDLTEKGKGTLNIFANDLSNGIYTFSLIIDGQTIETKKMVKAK